LFPGDPVLREIKAESYVGITLRDSAGQPTGLIAVIGRRPLQDVRLAESILQLVGVRASGELERLMAKEATEASLRDKELLLREIHHRVKNNLQIVSSMLNLQSEYFRDPRTVELLAESQNRIRSISLIHDMLYRSNDLYRVNLGEYIESLTAHLIRSFGNERSKIDLRIKAENIILGLDTAIPCGLIINELVSNSLKYAFPDGRKGLITVDLRSCEGGDYALAVKDNGVGFPEGLDYRHTTTLGLQLVGMFVQQLEGVMELRNSRGTEVRITFKELKYLERS
jgi:two-component sensor histidine kinase